MNSARLLIALSLVVSAAGLCYLVTKAPSVQTARAAMDAPSSKPKPTRAATDEPTPTISYAATAAADRARANSALATAHAVDLIAANLTADANRITAAKTEQAGEIVQQRLQNEADALRATKGADALTQTAAPTAIPLTQTAHVEDNQRTVQLLAVSSGMLTATKEAPTQVVSMARAQAEAKYAGMEHAAYVWGIISVSTIVFAISVLIVAYLVPSRRAELQHQLDAEQEAMQPEPVKIQPLHTGTVFSTETVTPDGFIALDVHPDIATPAQLYELAERVIVKHESLSVNNFEGRNTTWTREVYYGGKNHYGFRRWGLEHRYLRSKGQGRVDWTDAGLAFLHAVLEEYSPSEGAEIPSHGDLRELMAHMSGAHGHEQGEGEGQSVS